LAIGAFFKTKGELQHLKRNVEETETLTGPGRGGKKNLPGKERAQVRRKKIVSEEIIIKERRGAAGTNTIKKNKTAKKGSSALTLNAGGGEKILPLKRKQVPGRQPHVEQKTTGIRNEAGTGGGGVRH